MNTKIVTQSAVDPRYSITSYSNGFHYSLTVQSDNSTADIPPYLVPIPVRLELERTALVRMGYKDDCKMLGENV